SEVIQPKTMAFTPDGQHLLVASKQLDGKIAVIDPASFTKLQEVPVGIGPEDMAIAPDKIFVVNVSGNTVSVISFPGYGQLTTIGFTD
ncbi:MAG: hypothetical protein GWN00_13775, partial [Aliifodinibius sp.]|nr:hypothetical protein [Fodinibius sp.]NIV12176.1 hypothetical protein [Fodinibius sp.]NIY25836.1 hypothetical protein [Fodinibius sp.]